MRTKTVNHWLKLIAFIFLLAAPGATLAHTINGHAEGTIPGWVPYGAVVRVFEVDPVPGGSYSINQPELASATVDSTGNFVLSFPWPSGTGFEVGNPDLIFEFAQNIGGSTEIIYQEGVLETRWNVADGASLNFALTSPLAVLTNPSVSSGSIPNNYLFLFTRVGNWETANIDCKGSDPFSSGYYRPRKAPFNSTGQDTDVPFGSTLDLFAWFGKLSQITYYKVQFSTDGGATWTDVESSLPNKWYDTSDPNPLNWKWVSESMGPFSYAGQENLYRIPYFVRPDTPWSYLDRIAQLNSTLASNGLCRIKIVGFKLSGAVLVPTTSTDLLIDPNYGEISLQLDNTPPSVQILKVNNSTAACQIISFGTTSSDKITIDFRIYDQRGHLEEYTLDAMYGHNQYVTPRPTSPDKADDNYQNNALSSPSWTGSLSYKTEYIGNIQDAAKMPSCAYQFRLSATKRTTNGYGRIYVGVEDTWHVTIQR